MNNRYTRLEWRSFLYRVSGILKLNLVALNAPVFRSASPAAVGVKGGERTIPPAPVFSLRSAALHIEWEPKSPIFIPGVGFPKN